MKCNYDILIFLNKTIPLPCHRNKHIQKSARILQPEQSCNPEIEKFKDYEI